MKSVFGKKDGEVGRSTQWHRTATYQERGHGPTLRNRYRTLVERQGERWPEVAPMTEDEYATAIAAGRCHWCESDIFTGKTPSAVGLDRIDNSIGYLVGNVVAACPPCNMERRTLSFEEYGLVLKLRKGKRAAQAAYASAMSKEKSRLSKGSSVFVAVSRLNTEYLVEQSGVCGMVRTNKLDVCKAELAKRIAIREIGLDPDSPLPEPPEALADVESWRSENGLTQRQAAALLGISRRTVQRVENEGKTACLSARAVERVRNEIK